MKKSPHRETSLSYDNVILGSSVHAMVAAYVHQVPIFGNITHRPIPYYFIEEGVDLSSIGVDNKTNTYTNLSGTEQSFGMQQIELWNIMMHRLSIMGLAPMFGDYYYDYFTELTEIVKMKSQRNFSLSVKSKIVNIQAENIIIFDYPSFYNGSPTFMVNDHVRLRNVKNLKADIINEVVPVPQFMDTSCYQSIVYKEGKHTNCCVKSIVSEDNMSSFDTSETSIRLKTEASFYWNVDKKIKVDSLYREKSPVLKPMYTDLEELVLMDIFAQELVYR